MDKKKEYERLVGDVKASYTNLKPDLNNKKIYMVWCDDCEEINLWTYWQGRGTLSQRILLVGQDWGSIKGAEEDNFARNIIEINKGITGTYISDSDSVTDNNLNKLFESIGYHDVMHIRYQDLFFTNLSLGYRSEGTSGNLKMSWLRKDYDFFERLVAILQPEIIICLGRATFKGVLTALKIKDKPKINRYNDFICSKSNPAHITCYGKDVSIFGVAHCGTMGTLNRNDKSSISLERQIKDWSKIAAVLKEHE